MSGFGDALPRRRSGCFRRKAEQFRGRYRQAVDYHRRAMTLLVQAGDHAGQARTLNKLGAAAIRQRRFQSAAMHFGRAPAAYRQAGDQTGEAIALSNLGLALQRLDRSRRATTTSGL